MKHILFPTDFSDASINALEYGIRMLYGEEYEVILFNSFEVPIPSGDQAILPENYLSQLLSLSSASLERTKEKILDNHQNLDANIRLETGIGTLRQAVEKFIEKNDVDLIIMGTHGATGMAKFFIGSNTYELIRHIKKPILSIPHNYEFKTFSKITLAVEFDVKIKFSNFNMLLWMARKFEAKIHVLNVLLSDDQPSKEKEIEKGQEMMDEFLNNVDHEFKFIEADNVEEGIMKFMDKNHSEMLSLITTDHGFFERLFHSSVTKKISMEARVPLLSIHS